MQRNKNTHLLTNVIPLRLPLDSRNCILNDLYINATKKHILQLIMADAKLKWIHFQINGNKF